MNQTKRARLPVLRGKPPRLVVDRPPVLRGFEWQRLATGWALRRVFYVNRKRHRRYVKHLSATNWRSMAVKHAPEQLPVALTEWLEQKGQK